MGNWFEGPIHAVRVALACTRRGIALVPLVALSNCAAMQAQYEAQHCTHDAAYAAGVNAGKNGQNMSGDYASVTNCTGDATDATALNNAYAAGFKFGLRSTGGGGGSRRPAGYECKNSFGKEICGYHCVEQGTNVRCAPTPDQRCIAGGFGNIACGYNCAKSNSTVKCAQRRRDNCAADNFGNVKCGRNCRLEFGNLKCDEQGTRPPGRQAARQE